jgi:hypothetical protein
MQSDIHAASMAAHMLADICHDAGALTDVSVFRDASVIGPTWATSIDTYRRANRKTGARGN